MKSIIYMIILFFNISVFAQNSNIQEYNEIMNYVPKGMTTESIFSNNKLLEDKINTLGQLKVYYELQDKLKLTEQEIKWLEMKIDEIAVAFFLENKPILIDIDGGYAGCKDENIKKEKRNGTEVSILSFCYGCTDFSDYSNTFIRIFNNRTNKLLKNSKILE